MNEFTFLDNACPIAAHIRKTNPRDPDGNKPENARAKIIRNGIPYGSEYVPKVTDKEERGLLFACYQSHIMDGFQLIQTAWANNVNFPPGDTGHDPIIGQDGSGKISLRIVDAKGTIRPTPPSPPLVLPEVVTMMGGEYFFVPSISALQTTLSQAD